MLFCFDWQSVNSDYYGFWFKSCHWVFYIDHILIIRYEFKGRKIGMKGYVSSKLQSIPNWYIGIRLGESCIAFSYEWPFCEIYWFSISIRLSHTIFFDKHMSVIILIWFTADVSLIRHRMVHSYVNRRRKWIRLLFMPFQLLELGD
jgi:hypothetical protein